AATATATSALADSTAAAAAPRRPILKVAVICAANQNRSMEAHNRLASHAYSVISFGTGSQVRLPGPSITQPNVYNFNSTTYAEIADELRAKDRRLYTANGVLQMLERNRAIKHHPERFQDWRPGMPRLEQVSRGDRGSVGTEGGVVDVIITCEERCWDAVVDDLMGRGGVLNRPVHVFNVDIRDNHEEAMVGSKGILELVDMLNQAAEEERRRGVEAGEGQADGELHGEARRCFDERVPEILGEWQDKYPNLPAQWTLSWF
ncbi:RNA polymerase II subunit A C-terminal domain phosphatase, partial [Ascosphaera acerosa]